MADYFENLGACIPDRLIAGHDIPIITTSEKIASGEGSLSRGSVLAAGTDGKLKLLSAGSSEATEVPYGILCDDVDATSEVVAEVYISGQFNARALITKESYAMTKADIKALRDGGIYIEYAMGEKEE